MAAHGAAFDVIVIAFGPAGQRAVVRAAKLEKSVRKKTHSIRHIKPSL
jgi:pyruvate/2-oxoglutarate dehydrogenase complex dihydrolipoamide dehydrogenase (E3) component